MIPQPLLWLGYFSEIRMYFSKLDALNLCLSGIGIGPVSTLSTESVDAANAIRALDNASVKIQTNRGNGWYFNREVDWKLTPDPINGEVTLPNNTLAILADRTHYCDNPDYLQRRGNRVYDMQRHTYDLSSRVDKDGKIGFMIVVGLEFDALPEAAKQAIAWRARRLFCQDQEGDPNTYKMQTPDEQMAWAELQAAEMKSRRHNYFRNGALQRFVARGGGPNAR